MQCVRHLPSSLAQCIMGITKFTFTKNALTNTGPKSKLFLKSVPAESDQKIHYWLRASTNLLGFFFQMLMSASSLRVKMVRHVPILLVRLSVLALRTSRANTAKKVSLFLCVAVTINWRSYFMMNFAVFCRSSSQPCSVCSRDTGNGSGYTSFFGVSRSLHSYGIWAVSCS